MEYPGQRSLFGIFKKGKEEIVDQTCVMKKILRDERNHKDDVCYKRVNRYQDEKFDSKLDYDDIEAGMEIELWWPYQETEKVPEGGRFRKVHVIETEVQKDEHDDDDETLQRTFREAGMIEGHYFKHAEDSLLSEYLLEFLQSYDVDAEFKPQNNRKRELKSQIENLGNDFDDQKSRLKKKRQKLSKSIAFKVELANANIKIGETPKSENETETEKKVENESDSVRVKSEDTKENKEIDTTAG